MVNNKNSHLMLVEYSKLVQPFWIIEIICSQGDYHVALQLGNVPRYMSSRKLSGLKQQFLNVLLESVGQAGHIGLFKMVEAQMCKSNPANASQAFGHATPINCNGQRIQGGIKNCGYQSYIIKG